MRNINITNLFHIFSLAALLCIPGLTQLSGCSTGQNSDQEGCSEDADCPGRLICEQAACVCTTDDTCENGFYCNNWGSCQPKPPCLSNADCDDGEICNTSALSGGTCIPRENCASDVHCDFNEYCDLVTSTCQSGCQDEGDCQLGHLCQDGQCVAGECSLCPTSPEPNSEYCEFGDVCTVSGSCSPHEAKNSLCSDCTLSGSCGDGMICLLDDLQAGANYCAPTCETEADCPNGYRGCGGVQLVTQTGCSSDSDCTNGGQCVFSAEGDLSFCTCVADNDCVPDLTGLCLIGTCISDFTTPCSQDSDCLCTNGECANLPGFPCTSGADCMSSCQQVDNGQGGTLGICETNIRTCGKGEGMSCSELTSGDAPCQEF